MKVIQRTPVEAWRDMYALALRFPPSRWLLGSLFLPGTPVRVEALALTAAAWQADRD